MSRICLHIQNLQPGGAEGVMVEIANHLYKSGHDVDFVLVENRGVLRERLAKGIKLISLDCKSPRKSILKLSRYLKERKPDYALVSLKENIVAMLIAKKLSKARTRITIREANTLSSELQSSPSLFGQAKNLLKKIVIKKTYPLADAIVALSYHMRDEISLFTGIDRNKISVIYNPLNSLMIDELSIQPIDNAIIHKAKNKKIITSLARVEESKGYPALLKALSILRKKHNDFVFFSLGDGTKITEFTHISSSYGLSDIVHFLGHQPNPFNILKKSDCFVLASLFEGMPNSLIQALYLGIPVVATDCPGATIELLEGFPGAIIAKTNDPQSISDALEKILYSSRTIASHTHYDCMRFNYKSVLGKYEKIISGNPLLTSSSQE